MKVNKTFWAWTELIEMPITYPQDDVIEDMSSVDDWAEIDDLELRYYLEHYPDVPITPRIQTLIDYAAKSIFITNIMNVVALHPNELDEWLEGSGTMQYKDRILACCHTIIDGGGYINE